MAHDIKHIFEAALELPPEARAALAGTLLDSLEGPVDETVENAWADEIKRRLRELDSGTSKTIPWAEARRQILG